MGIKLSDIKRMSNQDLIKRLTTEYYEPIPTDISSAEQMKVAGVMLADISNKYAYLMVLLAYAKAETRSLKLDKTRKTEYEEMIGKRDTIEAYVNILKQLYSGLSREISTREDMLKEINMSSAM